MQIEKGFTTICKSVKRSVLGTVSCKQEMGWRAYYETDIVRMYVYFMSLIL